MPYSVRKKHKKQTKQQQKILPFLMLYSLKRSKLNQKQVQINMNNGSGFLLILD